VAELQELAGEADARVKEALDSARAALRGGAAEVTIVSLENFDEMPVLRTTQGHEEFEEAQKEGVSFVTRRGPRRFIGEGRLRAIELRRCSPSSTRPAVSPPPTTTPTSSRSRPTPASSPLARSPTCRLFAPADGIALTPGGTIKVDPATLATSAPGIFAGAMWPSPAQPHRSRGQREAGRPLHPRVPVAPRGGRGREARDRETADVALPDGGRLRAVGPRGAAHAGRGPADRHRRGRDWVRRRGCRQQAARCLVCHIQTIYDPELCVLCNRCVDICPEYCLAIVRSTRSTRRHDAGGTDGARRGQRPPACRDDQRRRAVHPVRAVRDPLSHRRDDDGALHHHRTLSAAGPARRGCRVIRRAGVVPRSRASHEDAMTEPTKTEAEKQVTAGTKRSATPDTRTAAEQQAAQDASRLPAEAGRRGGRGGHCGPGDRLVAIACANVSYDAPTTVKLGLATEFPDGLKFLPTSGCSSSARARRSRGLGGVHAPRMHGASRGAVAAADHGGGRGADAADAPVRVPVPRLDVLGRRHPDRGASPKPARVVPAVGGDRRRAAGGGPWLTRSGTTSA